MRKSCLSFLAGLLALLPANGLLAADNVRVLYDFEDDADLTSLAQASQGITYDASQDRCVTSGKRCARAIWQKGGQREINLPADKRQNWKGFDYLGIDVFSDESGNVDVGLHFLDGQSRNRDTRASMHVNIVPGKQTLLIPINRLKRNNKEGRGWEELEAKDKLDLNGLTNVKLYIAVPGSKDVVLWMDNIRLLKEDALGLNMNVELPAGAQAFLFGKPKDLAGFRVVPPALEFDGKKGFSQKADLKSCGKRWPDSLCGAGVYSPSGKPFTFEAAVPDGEYLVWISAGQMLRRDIQKPRFLLKVGDATLYDDAPSTADLYSTKYMFRFLNVPYSERENALWLDFVSKMYPVHQARVKVTNGKLAIEACNYQLSSVIIVPAREQAAFDKMTQAIEKDRMHAFYALEKAFNRVEPKKEDGDGDYVCFIPDDTTSVNPSTSASKAERARAELDLVAAPSQNLLFRVAVTPFADLGPCAMKVSAIQGPGEIAAGDVRIYFQDFRRIGTDVIDAGLMPTNQAPLEKGITRCFWAWIRVPTDAKPGDYTGSVTLTPGKGLAKTFPLKLKVLPIKLEPILPYSFGLWYDAEQTPDPAQRKRIIKEQLEIMREAGMTATTVESPNRDGAIDTFLIDLLKEMGMGRHPDQQSITYALSMGRAIARTTLGLGKKLDDNPGCEFDQSGFKDLYLAAARKMAANIEKYGLPMSVQTIDEPRETPNPWNRNLEQTNLYADWLREAGNKNIFVDPMSDENRGKDYTALVDHHDIIGTHAGKQSERLMLATITKKKTLWLYNTGMDRLSWGFYNWRVGSTGRWEWHFRHLGTAPDNGYLNEEWYNPFTQFNNVIGASAPYTTHRGGIVFSPALLTAMEGMTDSTYIYTLLRAMENAKDKPAKAATMAKAQALLDGIRQEIPFLPGVKGIASAADGALVGQGLTTPVAAKCETWRRQIADLLVALQ